MRANTDTALALSFKQFRFWPDNGSSHDSQPHGQRSVCLVCCRVQYRYDGADENSIETRHTIGEVRPGVEAHQQLHYGGGEAAQHAAQANCGVEHEQRGQDDQAHQGVVHESRLKQMGIISLSQTDRRLMDNHWYLTDSPEEDVENMNRSPWERCDRFVSQIGRHHWTVSEENLPGVTLKFGHFLFLLRHFFNVNFEIGKLHRSSISASDNSI